MSPSERPIGVFDSGVGGLTVFRALKAALPREKLVYFGDTAHLPYGSKSPESVRAFSAEIAEFLVREEGIKLLVVACNTASSFALGELKKRLKIPVIGVIEPGAQAALAASRKGVVGVIGTEGTVGSHAYRDALKRRRPGVKVHEQACPLFVPLVEEGRWNGGVTSEVARGYLRGLKRTGMDTLILGCTHYPLLRPVLARVAGKGVALVDSGEATAAEARAVLQAKGLAREAGKGSTKFYASDAPDRFRRLARRLLGVAVPRVQVRRFS